MKRLFGILSIVGIIVLLSSCSLYHKIIRQNGTPLSSADDYVIQIDDYGTFWDPEIPSKALKAISESAQRTNTIVLLFIHGWHHNAAPDDENVEDFAKALSAIRKKLDDNVDGRPGIYRRSRLNLTGNGDVKVMGIYVGWRGKSLPMPFDYFTFWGRKDAAERVGEGDLKEFLTRLNGIYRQRLAARETSKVPFMGLISFGHSFGGQVLFRSVASELEEELISASDAVSVQDGKITLTEPISGFGTMTVLVNPALEAFQYDRIDQLSRQLIFDSRQTPVLLVVSSETDFARRYYFPLGRFIGSIFSAQLREEQWDLWMHALGEYEPQRTHRIDIVDVPPIPFDADDYLKKKCEIIDFDLTNIPSIAGVRLTPLNPTSDPFSPFIVAFASGKVVLEHSGIFEERLRSFLNDYVALAQGKRILLADPDASSCLAVGR